MLLRWTLPIFVCICVVLPGTLTRSARAEISSPVIALHAKAHTTKGTTVCGTWAPNDLDCTQFNTAGRIGVPYDAYVVAINPGVPASIAGLRWAMDYNGEPHQGVDVFSWTGCGDAEFQMDGWPGPKLGNTLTWDFMEHCQTNRPGSSGAQAVAGAFYLYAYSDDVFSIFPFFGWVVDKDGHWVAWQDPYLEIADCRPTKYFPNLEEGRGAVRFSAGGTEIGFNPCTGEGSLPPIVPPDPPGPPPPPPPPPTQDHKATILLHIGAVGDRGGSCGDAPAFVDSVVTSAPYTAPGAEYNVFLLATPKVPNDSVGVAALQFGIQYGQGLHVLEWHVCSGAELRSDNWPGAGSGNTILWGPCQSNEISVAGYFRVALYDPSVLAIVGHPLTGLAKLADCTGERILEDLSLSQAGWISLGGAAIGQDKDGCNPVLESCTRDLVPAHPITWGKLKAKY
jgi:hypothetical protein